MTGLGPQLSQLGLLFFPGLLEVVFPGLLDGTYWVLRELPKLCGERDRDRCGAGNSASGHTGSNSSRDRLNRLNFPASAFSARVVVSVSVSVYQPVCQLTFTY